MTENKDPKSHLRSFRSQAVKLRLKVPFHAAIFGASEKLLDPQTAFEHLGYKVRMWFDGQAPHSLNELPEESRHFRWLESIVLEIIEPGEGQSLHGALQELLAEDQRPRVVNFLASTVNRVLRAIRNFGMVIHIAEVNFRDEEAEAFLRKWDVEASYDGESWERLTPDSRPLRGFAGLLLLAGSPSRQEIPELRATKWPDIEEAIQDDLQPGPEQEFLTNAIEHIRLRNFRLALLEAIVCLEIVLSQFLGKYLVVQKGLSENRLNKVLKGPQIGLTTRVGLLLELILNASELRSINVGEVLKAISWRNQIVHETGHLPSGVSEEEIRNCIMNVLYTGYILSRKRDEIAASPGLKELAQAIHEAWNVTVPRITIVDRHRVIVQFEFLVTDEFPNDQKMSEIAEDLSRRLQERDRRFRPEEHLFVRYSDFPQETIAVWSNGKLEVRREPRPRIRLEPQKLEPVPQRDSGHT